LSVDSSSQIVSPLEADGFSWLGGVFMWEAEVDNGRRFTVEHFRLLVGWLEEEARKSSPEITKTSLSLVKQKVTVLDCDSG